jgi:hypothetical protein
MAESDCPSRWFHDGLFPLWAAHLDQNPEINAGLFEKLAPR